MNAYSNYSLFVQWNRLEVQILTLKAQKEDPELIAVYQEEQDLIFRALNVETQREMLDMRRLRELEARLDMQPRQYCPYHEETIVMEQTGEMSYTHDETGRTTGAYHVIACPVCNNHEMEGVRA